MTQASLVRCRSNRTWYHRFFPSKISIPLALLKYRPHVPDRPNITEPLREKRSEIQRFSNHIATPLLSSPLASSLPLSYQILHIPKRKKGMGDVPEPSRKN